MMIDSIVWAAYINVTDRQTDSHVAMVNAAPTHYAERQKMHDKWPRKQTKIKK